MLIHEGIGKRLGFEDVRKNEVTGWGLGFRVWSLKGLGFREVWTISGFA